MDFASVTGRIKPLHGMCNGPLSPGTDLGDLFIKMGVPCVRFADAGGKQSGLYVNVSSIFPDASADEYDPKNYRFAPTDTLLRAAAESGARIVYALVRAIAVLDMLCPKTRKSGRACALTSSDITTMDGQTACS